MKVIGCRPQQEIEIGSVLRVVVLGVEGDVVSIGVIHDEQTTVQGMTADEAEWLRWYESTKAA